MDMKKAGAHLKSIREARGLSYEQIYENTKIQPEVLKQIEEGEFVLADVFLKGFIRSYARSLSVNLDSFEKKPKESIQSFSAASSVTKQPSKNQDRLEWFVAKIAQAKYKLILLFLFIFLFFIKVVFFTESSIDKTSFLKNSKSQGMASLVLSSGLISQPSFQQEKRQVKKILSKSFQKKQSEIEGLSAKDLVKPRQIVFFTEKLKSKVFSQEILIRSAKKLEIYFKTDKRSLQTRLLKSNLWYSIKAVDRLYLRFDNQNDIEVFHNGKQLSFKKDLFEKIFKSNRL